MNNTDNKGSAIVSWDGQGQPLSTHFDDIYFSKVNGLEESRYVFLQHNQLEQRFLSLTPKQHFTIAETGFGTGLNFLACWQLWQSSAPPCCRLHYISVEKYPLHPSELQRSLQLWPELSEYQQALCAAYKKNYLAQAPAHSQRLSFGNIELTLIIDSAETGLKTLLGSQHPDFCAPYWAGNRVGDESDKSRGVDAWFFDGFAPSKNPGMWTEQLFITAAKLSHQATTFATFTAAGLAKRNLSKAGFQLQKVRGFANKRDMLIGTLAPLPSSITPPTITPPATTPTTPTISASKAKNTTPWNQIRHYQAANHQQQAQQKVAIIGAGLAGCHSAYALAKRGFAVTVIDRNPQPAQGASGNPQGIIYAKLSAHPGELGAFNLAALLYAQQFYPHYWQATGNRQQQCGVLQLAYTPTLATHYQAIGEYGAIHYLSPADASRIAGHSIQHPALYFPHCGWLQPPALCQWLLQHPNITLLSDTKITELQQHQRHNQHYWQLKSEQISPVDDHLYHQVIIANAYDAAALQQTHWLPLKPIRGQISYINSTPSLSQLQTVVCGKGYIAPSITIAGKASHSIGASFTLRNASPALSDQDHQQNLQQLLEQLPALQAEQEDITISNGRVGFRCTSPDYLPMVGPVPNTQAFQQDFGALSKKASQSIAIAGDYLPQLYTNIAHGSRGLAYTPLAAEILASLIAGEPPPASQSTLQALNPARFLIRALIKNKDYPLPNR